jgi:dTDP-glucose 4,6-dehydratase
LKSILVTGGCGFIGTNFIKYILEETDFTGKVVNIDKITYAGNPANLAEIEKKYPKRYFFVHADISDKQSLNEICNNFGINAICHFAAESHVDRSIIDPNDFINTNIIGTYNLLELSRERKDQIKLFHHVSTDEVFGSLPEEGFFTEDTPYRPNSPYSASKASSDHLVRAYNKTYGIPVTISNCSNNYGPFQFPEKLIPLMILNALEGKSLPVYGDGQNTRDWLYVKDHCKAIWIIMQNGKIGDTYNIGGDNELRNVDVVDMICDILDHTVGKINGYNSRKELIKFVKDRPGHDMRYAINFSKINRELGWHPSETFNTGLTKTIQWYLKNSEWIKRIKSGEYTNWINKHYSY